MSLRNVFGAFALIAVFVVLGLRSSYEQSVDHSVYNVEEGLTEMDSKLMTSVDSGDGVPSSEKVSAANDVFIEHSERPCLLTIYLMDENGDPTEKSAEIYWDSDKEKGSSPIDGNRIKLELFQGDYLVRARFKENGHWRYSLPVLIDLEPEDDEELDLVMQPAMTKALQAELAEGHRGFLVEASKGRFLKTGDIIQEVNQHSIANMNFEKADMFLGDCIQEGQVTLLVESPDSRVKELKIK